MGLISKFDLNRIHQDFNTTIFIETGTWKGDAVQHARATPFEQIISIEIIPHLAREAQERFSNEPRVKIREGKSVDVLQEMLPGINSNCLFWLDAHYPGAEEGLEQYDARLDEDTRLPLQKEVELIHTLRKGYRDVIIIDDLRVYEEGQYEKGNAPVDTLPRHARSIDFVARNFAGTHQIVRCNLDEGYLLVFPLPAFNQIRRDADDIYLAMT